ncbi:hypothetical protein [Synechocystis sp. CACIAM 05]|uniref:hypothetical protein n=1 Tax=Synechocystis sp. CACIAM 05 TaxID=1933929 RepID=UPI00138E5764|nr:hypothetical protein [Synechocystis sp. CACIAM 05]QHV00266.1 hypothetical protein BWK47_09080 [Synechocystis sp. CACIAM 05]
MSVKLAVLSLLASTFTLPLLLPSSVQAQTLIPGKQCVFNNGAFSVNVDWYDPGSIIFIGKDVTEAKDYSKYQVTGNPVDTKKDVTLGFSSCTEGANRVAVVRIVGHDIANSAIIIAAGTLAGVATGVGGAFVCAASVGAGCVTLAVVAPVTGGTIAAVEKALPEVKEIAYIGSPGTENYVDLSGTIWQVGIANNIPLSDSRGFDKVATFFTGGTPGPRSISFNNQAGYVAEMVVMYFQKQDIGGGNFVDMPVVKTSGNISVGRTVHINVPLAVSNQPIQVFIKGVATLKPDVYSTTVPVNFSGNRCYKSFGTIFDAQGSTC